MLLYSTRYPGEVMHWIPLNISKWLQCHPLFIIYFSLSPVPALVLYLQFSVHQLMLSKLESWINLSQPLGMCSLADSLSSCVKFHMTMSKTLFSLFLFVFQGPTVQRLNWLPNQNCEVWRIFRSIQRLPTYLGEDGGHLVLSQLWGFIHFPCIVTWLFSISGSMVPRFLVVIWTDSSCGWNQFILKSFHPSLLMQCVHLIFWNTPPGSISTLATIPIPFVNDLYSRITQTYDCCHWDISLNSSACERIPLGWGF